MHRRSLRLMRSKLGWRGEYQKARLNLGPIISASAAKGNFFDEPSKLPPLMGFFFFFSFLLVYGDTLEGEIPRNSDKVPRSFCDKDFVWPSVTSGHVLRFNVYPERIISTA